MLPALVTVVLEFPDCLRHSYEYVTIELGGAEAYRQGRLDGAHSFSSYVSGTSIQIQMDFIAEFGVEVETGRKRKGTWQAHVDFLLWNTYHLYFKANGLPKTNPLMQMSKDAKGGTFNMICVSNTCT